MHQLQVNNNTNVNKIILKTPASPLSTPTPTALQRKTVNRTNRRNHSSYHYQYHSKQQQYHLYRKHTLFPTTATTKMNISTIKKTRNTTHTKKNSQITFHTTNKNNSHIAYRLLLSQRKKMKTIIRCSTETSTLR